MPGAEDTMMNSTETLALVEFTVYEQFGFILQRFVELSNSGKANSSLLSNFSLDITSLRNLSGNPKNVWAPRVLTLPTLLKTLVTSVLCCLLTCIFTPKLYTLLGNSYWYRALHSRQSRNVYRKNELIQNWVWESRPKLHRFTESFMGLGGWGRCSHEGVCSQLL